MSRFVHAVLLAAITTATCSLAGCKSDEDKLVGLMEEQADLIDKNKDDCDKMGEALSSWHQSNAEAIKALTAKLKDKKSDKEMEKKYEARINAMGEKMKGIGKCIANEKVAKALSLG
jgi:hypothetical protein